MMKVNPFFVLTVLLLTLVTAVGCSILQEPQAASEPIEAIPLELEATAPPPTEAPPTEVPPTEVPPTEPAATETPPAVEEPEPTDGEEPEPTDGEEPGTTPPTGTGGYLSGGGGAWMWVAVAGGLAVVGLALLGFGARGVLRRR